MPTCSTSGPSQLYPGDGGGWRRRPYTPSVTPSLGTDAIVYTDRSDIGEGNADEVRDRVRDLVKFVEKHEPQLFAYSIYVDERAGQMRVVAVHPDTASLELHMQVASAEFRKLASLITLREITVYGWLGEGALQLLREKIAMLGKGGSLVVHEPYAGFARVILSTS
jgi:quinol monooxygenase YgiN